MDKFELSCAIAKELDLSIKDSRFYLDALLDCMTEELINGRTVKFVNWGTFEVVQRAARKGFNPHIREEIIIPACKEPVFKPGKALKDSINEDIF